MEGKRQEGGESFSYFRPKPTINIDIMTNHLVGRKSRGVPHAFFAPGGALRGIGESQQIRRETFFIMDITEKSGLTGRFRHRSGIAANHWATAGMSFNDGPTKTLKGGRIN